MPIRFDRRRFLTASATLALAGCDRLPGADGVQKALDAGSDLTYAAAKLLPEGQLAPEYKLTDLSPFVKPNGSIDPKDPAYRSLAAAKFDGFSLPVGGLVEAPRSFSLDALRQLPTRTQITRHDCVEGWSAIGQWTGTPLRDLLALVRPKPEARYVVFNCFDRYATDYATDAGQDVDVGQTPTFYGSIGMGDALHAQTILAYAMNGAPLSIEHGAPLRLRVERQLGYKQTKYIRSIELRATLADIGQGKGGFWEDQGYEWYAGI